MAEDTQRLKVGKQPEGASAPTPPTVKTPTPATPPIAPKPAQPVPPAPPRPAGIVIPEATPPGSRRILFWAFTGISLLAVVFLARWIFGGSSNEAVTPTPTPNASPAPTLMTAPRVQTLATYFAQAQNAFSVRTRDEFISSLLGAQPAERLFQTVTVPGAAGTQLGAPELLSLLFPGIPADITAELGADAILLLFGQNEGFDTQGTPITLSPTQARVAVVGEVRDPVAVDRAMQAWESTTMATVIAPIFGIAPAQGAVPQFTQATYRQSPIRYRNFPFADKSIDWGVVTTSSGKAYLLISASRQSYFAAIDQLLSQ